MAQLTLSDYKNNLFSNHFLEERIQDMAEWEETEVDEEYEKSLNHYEDKKRYLKNNPNESRTWERFIKEIIGVLNHHPESEPEDESGLNPDFTLFTNMEEFLDAKEDNAEFQRSYGILEIKRWGRKLDKSSREGEKDDNTNPAYQTYNYVDRLRVPWGILTNGKKWRLYSYEKCGKKTFFEIDLVDNIILEQDEETAKRNFKLFYLLFRQKAFSPKGKGFADEVLEGTIKYNKQLKESLKKDVYSAVEEACKGFFEFTNQEATKENRELVHDSALTFMYRLLFVMNAESRGLLPIENQTYHEEYSVQWFQEKIAEKEEIPEFKYNTLAWDRLEKLFKGINSGEPLDKDTEIPPYNGGMFEHPEENDEVDPENRFLAENSIPGPFLKEIVKRLGTTREDGELKTVDYRDLNIRHLGSIYEGLLENKLQPPAESNLILKDEEWEEASQEEFDAAKEENRVEEGEVYLANDSGERKETGSYYTPDYIVEYIVENTIDPKIEETLDNFREGDTEQEKLRKILELNICDPAMGSGHFLTEATNHIADAVIENIQIEELEIEEDDETNWAKRQVVQNCIYGVDINPLATELAKVSLWIETMAEGKPLNFLDHHLKNGNSLIGSDFDEILSHPFATAQKSKDNDRFQFGGPDQIKEELEEKYREIEEKDEKTVEDIHEKEEEYKKFIRENEKYSQFKQLANIHTYQYFQEETSQTEYDNLLLSIGTDRYKNQKEYDWFQNAQQDAKNKNYFHWQLEFPKVFFGEKNGFDAVVGNPPYVTFGGRWTGDVDPEFDDAVRNIYPETAEYKLNMYSLFTQKGIDCLREDGSISYIVPDSFLSGQYYSKLRDYMMEKTKLDEIFYLSYEAWEDGDVGQSVIFNLEKKKNTEENETVVKRSEDVFTNTKIESNAYSFQELHLELSHNKFYLFFNRNELSVFKKLVSNSKELKNAVEFYTGLRSKVSKNDLVSTKEKNAEEWHQGLNKGKDVRKYVVWSDPVYIKVDEEKLHGGYNLEKYEGEKIFMRKTGDEIIAAVDREGLVTFDNLHTINLKDESYSLETVLSVLNSSLIDSYYSLTSLDKGRTLPQLNIEALNKLPLVENVSKSEKNIISDQINKIETKKKEFRDETKDFLDWVEAEWGVDVDDLSLKTHLSEYWEHDFDSTGTTPSFMRVARENKSQIDGSVKSREFRELMKEEWESSMDTLKPLMQEIDELENEIDSIVFDLYDLTEEEIKTVLDSLDTGEGEKERILEKFNEV